MRLRSPSPATVIASLALFLALGGTAIAAHHYLITSTGQIKPSVLNKLRGATGAKGDAGTPGKEGPAGKEGPQGKEGPAGPSALATLPSGRSESGVFATGANTTTTAGFIEEAITFSVPLAAAIPSLNVILNEPGKTSLHCSGVGHAAAGYLCLYVAESTAITELTSYTGEEERAKGAGRFGADLSWATSAAKAYADGVYTVTAP